MALSLKPANESDSEVRRLDVELTLRGLARSRTQAQERIDSGKVRVNGEIESKSRRKILSSDLVEVAETTPYVGRGGRKLEAALDAFEIDPTQLRCLDIGASTGGFTDCLLRRGAGHVTAVDVGHGQMALEISENSRVDSREGINARHLDQTDILGPFDLIVIDVSFISLTLILPAACRTLDTKGSIVSLIKPQFEVGRNGLSSGGVVRDSMLHNQAVEKVTVAAKTLGLERYGLIDSPISGGDGNQEFLAWFRFATPEQIVTQ